MVNLYELSEDTSYKACMLLKKDTDMMVRDSSNGHDLDVILER